jgi:DNA polymerase-3 subunit gamma/tau
MRAASVPAQPITEVRGSNVVSMLPSARAEVAPITPPSPVKLEEVAPILEPAAAPPAKIPPTSSTAVAADDDAQRAVVEALAAAKHASAADAMADATWTITSGEATIQTELSKIMLSTVINAEADKIVRNTLRAAGIAKVTQLPGTNSSLNTAAAEKKPKPARSGSVHAKALEHPMVQAAQKLFDAEIQTVIDLREED